MNPGEEKRNSLRVKNVFPITLPPSINFVNSFTSKVALALSSGKTFAVPPLKRDGVAEGITV